MSNVQTTINIVTGVTTNVSETEHIPITPSSELMLKIEEIPPLDVFYSPQHKAVVRRQRKKRKLENGLSHDAKQLDVLWQDPTTDPTQNLTKLSQITGAYASAAIDKESEVQQLLNEKEIRYRSCNNSCNKPMPTTKHINILKDYSRTSNKCR